MSTARSVCADTSNLFSSPLTSYESPVSSVKPCAKTVFFWSLQDFCTKAASLNHFKQRADAGRWPCSIITEAPLMEGNFFSYSPKYIKSFLHVRPSVKQTNKNKRTNFGDKREAKESCGIKCDQNTKPADAAVPSSIKGNAAYSWISGYFQPSSLSLSINPSTTTHSYIQTPP